MHSCSQVPAKRRFRSPENSAPSLPSSLSTSMAGTLPHRYFFAPKLVIGGPSPMKCGGRPSACHAGCQVSFSKGDLQSFLCSGQCFFWHSAPQYCEWSQSPVLVTVYRDTTHQHKETALAGRFAFPLTPSTHQRNNFACLLGGSDGTRGLSKL